MEKKKRSVILSWILIFTMVFGSFQGLSFVSEAAEADKSYLEYTFSDFGIKNGTYSDTQVKNDAFSSFDGVAFTGKIKLQAKSTKSGIVITTKTDKYDTCIMLRSSEEGALYLINSFKKDASDELVGWDYTNFGCKSIEEMYEQPFEVRLAFDKTDAGYTLNATVNGVTRTVHCTDAMADAKHFIAWAGTPIEVSSVYPDYYTEYTFSDLGFEDGTYNSNLSKANVLKGYDKIALTGKLQFTGKAQTGLVFTSDTGSFGTALQIFENTDGNIWLWNHFNSQNSKYAHIRIGFKDIGYSSQEEMYNSAVSMRILFDKEGTDYRVRAIFNDNYVYTTYCPASFDAARHFAIQAAGTTLEVTSDTTHAKKYTEYTFSDLGLSDGTYTANTEVANVFSEYDGIAFTGKVKFGSDNKICFSKWGGVNFLSSQWIENYFGDTIGLSFTPDASGYVKMRVRFDKTSNGYRVIATFNDEAAFVTYASNDLTSGKSLCLTATEASPITIESVAVDTEPYTEYTFADFGIEAGTYAEAKGVSDTFSTVDRVAFTGTIAFEQGSATTGIVLTNSLGSYSTAVNIIEKGEGAIWVENCNGGVSPSVSYADLGFASADEFYGSPIKVRIRMDKINTEYRIAATFNDKVTKVTYSAATTFETVKHMVLWGQAGRAITVKNDKTDYTFSDVGIENGIYNNGNVQTWPVDKLDKVNFTANVWFPEPTSTVQPGFGFVRNAGDWNGLKFIIANDALYIQDFISGKDFSLGYAELGMESPEELTAQPLKIKSAFAISGNELTMTVTVNDIYTKSQVYEADKFTDVKSILVYGTEEYPLEIASDGATDTPDTPDVPEEPAGPVEADFSSFGMEANQIFGTTVSSTKVPNDAETLDNVKFTGYLKYAAQGESNYFSYGVNNEGKGIDFFWSGDALWVYDKTGGFTGPCFFGASKDDLGLSAATDEIKVTVMSSYTETGVDITITATGTKTVTCEKSIEGYQNYLGTGMVVKSTTGVIAYRSNTVDEFNAANQLEADGYQCLQVTDFGALEYKTYKLETDNSTSGDYSGANLDMTYLNMNLKFSDFDATGYLAYGATDGWGGVQFQYAPSANLFVFAQSEALETYVEPAKVGMTAYTDQFNLKIATKLCKTSDEKDAYLVNIWMNDILVVQDKEVIAGNVGKRLLLYTPSTCKIEVVAPTVTEITQDATAYNLRGYDHTTLQSYYVAANTTVNKGEEKVTVNNHKLDTPGDYTMVTYVSSTAKRYTREVALYILGDVNLDGTAGTSADVTALENMLKDVSRITPATAAEYAADIDNNGVVDKKDLDLLTGVKDNSAKLVTLLKKYYVPSKTYDFLGGNDVMPIVGYNGPYTSAEKDYLTDDIYRLIKGSGVNMINHSINDANGGMSLIRKAMTLADANKLGWFVDDIHVNEASDDATIMNELGKYSYFESFLGIHIVDEPSYTGATDNPRPVENYTSVSGKLNAFSNVTGFVNMVAEDATTVNKYSSLWSSYKEKDYYDEYWEQYMKNANPQVISSDDYPFNNGVSEDATKAGGYFRTLGKIRQVSLAYNVPFWSYVQAGGNFDNDTDTTTENLIANEAETYWNVNTALAFGAKGIEWFPLIQPTNFDGTDASNPIDRNGVILSNGKASERYTWVTNANKQIAAVDDVLMKATSTAIVASGGYAKSQAKGQAKGDNNRTITTTDIATSWSKLQSVTSTSADYGALVGCFDYRDTEAFYVVNYDVTQEADVTLKFDNTYHVRVVQDGESKCGNMTGTTMTLKLGAGKAALVVLENDADAQCYYKSVKKADGSYVYQCVHTEGNVGDTHFGTAITYGDVNGDGKVGAADIIRMKKAIANTKVTVYPGLGDLNGDYKIDAADFDLYRNYLIGKVENKA